MAISLSPAYPLPGETATISESAAIGDLQVIELTSAPSASTMTLGFLLAESDQSFTTVLAIAEAGLQLDSVAFDAPGEYGVTVYDIRQWSGAPSFDGDSGGELYYDLIGTYSGTVHVAAALTLPLLAEGGAGAYLQIAVANEMVRAASLINATTELAYQATLQAAVAAALAAIVGDSVASMGTDLQTGVNDLRARYEAHRVVFPAVHFRADSTNTVPRGDADSQVGAMQLLNEIREALLGHLRDSSVGGALTRWHNYLEDDLKNLPIAPTATDIASATVLSADLRERCYERHRVQIANPASHGSADNVNALAAPSHLDDLIVTYFDALVIVDPSVVAGEPEGAVDAEHRYGFTQE